ncbi:hypothetical protein [Stenomitos frigidus]|uniref:Thioredoxin domain-containing protein n=1 Tax=Stenomitos frigidus ULC18 TaxID=2107698 RepID=A0A2T1E557_9CYAN|nr:hypothetical protein [Stenomitos frigidus]PSB27887.1 hypothetical protein C7B82_16060 [Stenomitos frigidus ULC18]
MKLLHALGIAATLVGTGLALAIGLSRSGPIPSDQVGAKEPETAIAQMTATQAKATAPPVTTTSSAAAIALAKHLKSVGAKMYGAYWCPHCHEQLQLFGQKAVTQLPYVECAEDGKNARPDLCKAAKIEGYPTWKIKGKTYEGAQELTDLANASTYKGSRNF